MKNEIKFGAGFRIMAYRPGDEDRILPIFSKVFPRPRHLEEWQWIYQHAPGGSGISLAWAPNGDLAAHYAGIFHRATLAGQDVLIGDVRDTFTSPSWRAVRQGRSLLISQTAQFFFDQWTGPGKAVFCYGFPHRRQFRLGRLTMDYRPFGHWRFYHCRLTAEHQAAERVTAPGICCRLEEFGPEFDRLWERRQRCLKFSVCRDAAFLSWRFIDHPFCRYQVWAYSPFLSKEVDGYIVVLPAGESAWLMDFCFTDSASVNHWLWRQVCESLRWQGISAISTWVTLSSPDLSVLENLGFMQLQTPQTVVPVFRTFDSALDVEWCERHFNFTMADSDLY